MNDHFFLLLLSLPFATALVATEIVVTGLENKVWGETLNPTITVNAVGGGASPPARTGKLKWTEGLGVYGYEALDGNSQVIDFGVTGLKPGQHSFEFYYEGDSTYANSTLTTDPITIDKAHIDISFAPPASIAFDEDLLLHIDFSRYGWDFNIYFDNRLVNTQFLQVPGNSQVDYYFPPFFFSESDIGTDHNITVMNGETEFFYAATRSEPIIITDSIKEKTNISLSFTPLHPNFNDQITVTVTVFQSAPPGGAQNITGQVQVFLNTGGLADGPKMLDTTPTPEGMQAIFQFQPQTLNLNAGSYTMRAEYYGDSAWRKSESASQISWTIVKSPSFITFWDAGHNTTVYSEKDGFGIRVTGLNQASGPTGTVQFYDEHLAVILDEDLSGTGELGFHPWVPLGIGSHALEIRYLGNTNYEASSTTVTNVVTKADVQISAPVLTPSSPTKTDNIDFSVKITPQSPANSPVTDGSISFSSNGVTLGTANVTKYNDGDYYASFASLPVFPTGQSVSVIGKFNGNDKFKTGTSSSSSFQVANTASTRVTTQVKVYGTSTAYVSQTISLKVNVTTSQVPFTLITSGRVLFYTVTESGVIIQELGQIWLSEGNELPFSPTLPAGVNNIGATFYGSDDAAGSVYVTPFVVTISQVLPTVELYGPDSNDVIHLGDPVDVSVAIGVDPFVDVVTGTVDFTEGGDILESGDVDISDNFVNVTLNDLAVGLHTVGAHYSGSDVYQATDSSNTLTFTVLPRLSECGFSTNSPAFYGTNLPFNIFIDTIPAIPCTGTINVTDEDGQGGVVVLASGELNGNKLILYSDVLSVGVHHLYGYYFGGGNCGLSNTSGIPYNVTIEPANTTSTLTAPQSAVYGASILVTVSVGLDDGGGALCTGNITFLDGNQDLGEITLDEEQNAKLSISLSVNGEIGHSLSAIYGGDDNCLPSETNLISLVIHKAATTTTIVPSTFNPVENQQVQFTLEAQVVAPGGGVPAGNFTVYDNQNHVMWNSSYVGSKVKGSSVLRATFNVTWEEVGATMYYVKYSGNANYNGSQSNLITITGRSGTCSDGVQNQGETGVDCGGPCLECGATTTTSTSPGTGTHTPTAPTNPTSPTTPATTPTPTPMPGCSNDACHNTYHRANCNATTKDCGPCLEWYEASSPKAVCTVKCDTSINCGNAKRHSCASAADRGKCGNCVDGYTSAEEGPATSTCSPLSPTNSAVQTESITFTLRLNISCNMSDQQKKDFMTDLIQDICQSLSPPIPTQRLTIVSITCGSVITTLTIAPSTNSADPSANSVLQQIIAQFADPNSPLSTAPVTSNYIQGQDLNSTAVHTSMLKCADGAFLPTTGSCPAVKSDDNNSNKVALGVGLGLGLGLGLPLLIIGAYCLYKKKKEGANVNPNVQMDTLQE